MSRLLSVVAFLIVMIVVGHAEGLVSALTLRMAGDELRTRIVVMFDHKPELSTLLLRYPYRLVINLPYTLCGFDQKSLVPMGIVMNVRCDTIESNRSRMILSLRGPFKLENLQILKNEFSSGYRLITDIVATSDREFATVLKTQGTATRQVGVLSNHILPNNPSPSVPHLFTVMIDPGHGGIDSGAESTSGILEKNVTLTFARKLRDVLVKNNNIHVLMTRDDDVFLRLGKRVRLARQYEADLFLSIHADRINLSNIRGATVYTLSDQASDNGARATAERENKSDAIAGIALEEFPEVADILLDLTRRETHAFSLNLADRLVQAFQGEVDLINNPHRYASFQVLRAPDVPSVLLEIGYLSNPEDEKLITDPAWCERVTIRLAEAIKAFAAFKIGETLTKK